MAGGSVEAGVGDTSAVGTGARSPGMKGAVARWTGGDVGVPVRGPGAAVVSGVLSAGAVVRGAPSGERRRSPGRAAVPGAGRAGSDAGAGAGAGAAAGRTGAGAEVGAPRPGRCAAVLRWTRGAVPGATGPGRTAVRPAECEEVAASAVGRAGRSEAPGAAADGDRRTGAAAVAGAGAGPDAGAPSVARCTGGATVPGRTAEVPVGVAGAGVPSARCDGEVFAAGGPPGVVRRWTGVVAAPASAGRFAAALPAVRGDVEVAGGAVAPGWRPAVEDSAGGRPVAAGRGPTAAGTVRETARWTGGAEASGAVPVAPPPRLPSGVRGVAAGRTVPGADRWAGVLVAGVSPVAGVAGAAGAEGRLRGGAAGADVPLPGAVPPGATARCTGRPVAGS
ncbi:hypothetical protein SHO565_40760 [Streptomyces sp. HO565]